MTAFHTIAIPHADILAGRLTMDVFAADLWEVYQGRAPDEYQDARRFFQKTYETEGLRSLYQVVQQRLEGRGGDPVIQIQTPFGGGKTHALIALYHKAAHWGANRAVIVGTALSADTTLWGVLAEQLAGRRDGCEGWTAPGREALRALLEKHQPVMILMDEVLQYAVKAAGRQVGSTTLAEQTIAFMQELTEVAGTLDRVCVLVTLPASLIEHYSEHGERLYQQLQKVAGRVERIYTPVQDDEVACVIRRRLFASVDEQKAGGVIDEFLAYAARESLLPQGVEQSEYRDRFARSYPFLPEVVDVLYQRWGTLPKFQRTRGALRVLALVLYDLRDKPIPYITLADFDLSNQNLRQELLKHTSPEYGSVIAADITGPDAGARKVNEEIGPSYRGLSVGTRVSTAIFMHSFSGGAERGANLSEIKRHAAVIPNPSSIIAEATEQLRQRRLFHLWEQDGRYYFDTEPNLTRILLTREENISPDALREKERDLLRLQPKTGRFRVYVWPTDSNDIPDTPELKLLVLRERDDELMRNLVEWKGSTPRVYRNTLFCLVPSETEHIRLVGQIRQYLACESLIADKTVKLSDNQRSEVNDSLKRAAKDLPTALRAAYRDLYLPMQGGWKHQDLGTPTYGALENMDEEIYRKLRAEGEILERVAPLVIKERYLQNQEYVRTEQLVQVGFRTPGEPRVVSNEAWIGGIEQGVTLGLFGLGVLEDDRPACRYFKEKPYVNLAGGEVLIRADLCKEPEVTPPEGPTYGAGGTLTGSAGEGAPGFGTPESGTGIPAAPGLRDRLRLRFSVPKGKVSRVLGVMNFLQSKFNRMEVVLYTEDGSLSEQEYENNIKEAFRQIGVEATEE